MNENQRKWLLDLQSKGVKFENCSDCYSGRWIRKGEWGFIFDSSNYRIPAQPIPDIPDWRELCRGMQSNDVLFSHQNSDGIWVKSHFHEFAANEVRDRYQIPQQPIPEWREELNFEIEEAEYPIWTEDMLIKVENRAKSFLSKLNPSPIADQEWREEMTEETKPDQKEEIPHRELQIQWHEDMLHHLRTGEPMREWQWRKLGGAWQWLGEILPTWTRDFYYRRKPKTVTYWHCAVMFDGLKSEVITGCCKDEVSDQNRRCKKAYPDAKFSPIIETTVEVED